MNNEAEIAVVESTPDGENSKMELVAKLAAKKLSEHYPEHLWAVGWAPGANLVVKNMAIDDGRYGFVIHTPAAHSISDLERRIVMAGGELLERCGVRRGAWDGEFLHLGDKALRH